MMMMTCLILWMPELAARAGSRGGPCWWACAATLTVNAAVTARADAATTTRRNLIKSLHCSPGSQAPRSQIMPHQAQIHWRTGQMPIGAGLVFRRRQALEVGPDNAAIDLVGGAGDVAGTLGSQKRDKIAELAGTAEAAERNRRGPWREQFLERGIDLSSQRVDIGADPCGEKRAWKHEVDGDPVAGKVGHDRLHQARDARTDTVGEVDILDRLLDRHRLDAHDAAPAVAAHERHDLANEPDEAQRDNLERSQPVSVAHVVELADGRAARVRHQHVHSAKALDRRPHHVGDA